VSLVGGSDGRVGGIGEMGGSVVAERDIALAPPQFFFLPSVCLELG
jgi:hypothetical protein